MQICVARFFALHFEVTEIERGKEAELHQQERERRQERKQAQLWRSQYRHCLQIEVSLLFVLICFFFKRQIKFENLPNANQFKSSISGAFTEDWWGQTDGFWLLFDCSKFSKISPSICLLASFEES